jgi:cell division protease FtsH
MRINTRVKSMEENKDSNQKTDREKNNNGTKPPGNMLGGKKPRFNAMWIYAIIGIAIVLIYLFDSGQGPASIDWKFFQNELLLKKEIQKIQVVNEQHADISNIISEPAKHQRIFPRFNALQKPGLIIPCRSVQ